MRKTVALMFSTVLILSGCASADGGADPQPVMADGSQAGGGETASRAVPTDRVDVQLEALQKRQVIRRAGLQLHATNTRSTYEEITRLVQSVGGFVADATVSPTTSEDAQPEITLTLRVPVDHLDDTLKAIKDVADEVVSETQGAEDVTDQFVDLEARLTNSKALETELRALLRETRMRENADADEILEVFDKLSSVRGEIEQLQGQLDYLSDLTALATVDVGITQTPAAAPLVDEPWTPSETVRVAIGNLVAGLQNAADWLINFALYALPMLLIMVGPLVLIGVFVYRRFFRRGDQPAPAGP